MWCLPKEKADDFIAKLKDGVIDPEKLSAMTSEERNKFFGGIVGEDSAKRVNAEFESKLLLKDQKRGLVTWAKNVSGLKEPARRDILSKIEKLEQALTPDNQEMFLRDLVDTKLGVSVSSEDAAKIVGLSKTIEGASHDISASVVAGDKAKKISPFGRAMFELEDFIESKVPGKKGAKATAEQIVALQRAFQTGFEVSAIGRQGAGYFGTAEHAGATKRMLSYIKSKKNYDELAMRMYSDSNWERISTVKNDLGLTNIGAKMTQKEEAFATNLASKVPGLSHSERAYTGFLSDLRYTRFTNTVNALEKNGQKLDDDAYKALAEVISGTSGRGQLPGVLKTAGSALGQALFSPRWFASRIQMISNPLMKKGPARKEAIKGLARLAGFSTALILSARTFSGDVETNPISSDFGKLKVGNTRIDLTFGQGQYIRMMAQVAAGKYKTSKGEIRKLNTGEYYGRTRFDVVSKFFEGKASPTASLIMDMLKGQDWDRNQLGIDWKNLDSKENINTLARVVDMWKPLFLSDVMEAYEDGAGSTNTDLKKALTVTGLGAVGIGVQTYGQKDEATRNLGIDQRSTIEKLLKLPTKPDVTYKPLLDKMIQEDIRISVPTSATTIKPRGEKESREMTDKELQKYQAIYQKNLRDRLLRSQSIILKLTGKKLEKRIRSIKSKTTEKSKNELIRGMIK